MRDPKRLDTFYNELKQIHKEYFPDWRFGQLLCNFLSWYGRDPFYMEEDAFMKKIKEFVNETLA